MYSSTIFLILGSALAALDVAAFTSSATDVDSLVSTLSDYLSPWSSRFNTNSLSTFFFVLSSAAHTDLINLGKASEQLDGVNYQDGVDVVSDFEYLTASVVMFLQTLVLRASDFEDAGATSSVRESIEYLVDPYFSVAHNVLAAVGTVSCELLGFAYFARTQLPDAVSSATSAFSASVSSLSALESVCTASGQGIITLPTAIESDVSVTALSDLTQRDTADASATESTDTASTAVASVGTTAVAGRSTAAASISGSSPTSTGVVSTRSSASGSPTASVPASTGNGAASAFAGGGMVVAGLVFLL